MKNLILLRQAYHNFLGPSGVVLALHDHKAFCVLIPKVACSTLTAIIVDLLGFQLPEGCWKPGIFRGDTLDNLIDVKLRDAARLPRRDIQKLQEYWGFAFVRNPYDRLVSCYSEKISDNNEDLFIEGVSEVLAKYKVFHRGMSFADFVHEIVQINDFWSDPHFRSQSTFIFDRKGNKRVNFIGHFESLKDDLLIIAKHLGTSFDIPHLLKSDRKEWQSYYNNPLKEIVYKRYKKDFEYFGYAK